MRGRKKASQRKNCVESRFAVIKSGQMKSKAGNATSWRAPRRQPVEHGRFTEVLGDDHGELCAVLGCSASRAFSATFASKTFVKKGRVHFSWTASFPKLTCMSFVFWFFQPVWNSEMLWQFAERFCDLLRLWSTNITRIRAVNRLVVVNIIITMINRIKPNICNMFNSLKRVCHGVEKGKMHF